ncbi:MAG: integrase core domain-containing protein [Paracoccaceae bacterium]
MTATLEDALSPRAATAPIAHRPRLLSDNGSSHISGELADWLADEGMDHVRGAPRHPPDLRRRPSWHQTPKNRILLENYYLPGALEEAVATFIDDYNHHRYHESLGNLTQPTSITAGRKRSCNDEGRSCQTIEKRRLLHRQNAA